MEVEQEYELARKLRDFLFETLVPGVRLTKLPGRQAVKTLAVSLGIWDKVQADLGEIRAFSIRDQNKCSTIIVAEGPGAQIPGLYQAVWMVLYAVYNKGELTDVKGVLVISDEAEPSLTYQLACQAARKIGESFIQL